MTFMIDRYPCEYSPRLGAMILHPTPESVPRARRWFRAFIVPYNPACSIDDCALLISELVTNAIRYGQADETWKVRVEWLPRRGLAAGGGTQPRCAGGRAAAQAGCRRRPRARAAAGRLDRQLVAPRAQPVRRNGGLLRGGRCLALVREVSPASPGLRPDAAGGPGRPPPPVCRRHAGGLPFLRSPVHRTHPRHGTERPGSLTWALTVERVTRIELALSAWEATALGRTEWP